MNKVSPKIKVPLLLLCCLIICVLCIYSFLPMTHLHGAQLSKLSDAKLLKTVQAQNVELMEAYADEKTALASMEPARRTVYVLSIYEKEVESGGLCLFFVNETRLVAPYVEESLSAAGAQAHLALFSGFIESNSIDVSDLDSFTIDNIEEYALQEKRYDFASFDEQHYDLPALEAYIVNYIRANIQSF